MVIRILLTIIFLIIGYKSYKKSIIIEKEKNIKLKKDNKLNLLTSTIPYTLSKIFFIYAFCLLFSVLFLQYNSNEIKIVEKYNITEIVDCKENNLKNQTCIFKNGNEKIKIKNIDKVNIKNTKNNSYIEKYEIVSNNKIINFLLYGANENGLNVYLKEE